MMKHILLILFLVILAFEIKAQNRESTLLEKNWKFIKADPIGAESPNFDDSKWATVRVPHDWAISGPFDKDIDKQVVAIEQNGEKIPTEKTGRTGALPYVGTGWYRTTFASPNEGKCAILSFDGIMSCPTVYLNGNKVGEWKYGYNAFNIDITPYLYHDGKMNILAVRAEMPPMGSRWYPGGGIYRPVTLTFTDPIAFSPWGIRVTTPIVSDKYARIHIATETNNTDAPTSVHADIYAPDGTLVGTGNASTFADHTAAFSVEVNNPQLWSPEQPFLYTAKLKLTAKGRQTDEYEVRFGIRDIKISAEKGFMLNGVSRKIKGVCLHHDLGMFGAALNKPALRRQLLTMKAMGCDAIRTSHNMPSEWQMDLCDEIGLMVMAESFDEWKYPKCEKGYNRYFDEWVERDLVNLICHHANHPSIIMWCIGNEIPEQGSANGSRLALHLQNICHREDPTRVVTSGMDRVDAAVKSNFAAVLDVPGLNYRTHKYETAYKALPQGFILGSETASTISSRGVYKFPVVETKNATYPDFQCCSYDLGACSWSNIPEDDWILQDDQDWVIGEFVWTGYDYLGEPTPYDEAWPSRSSYFGICDLAGLPKDRYYLYKSRWNKDSSTLHLLPHWNWAGREGEITPVYCYTSYPTAELFVNGKSQGRKSKDITSRLDRYRLRWDSVRYEPGSIRVVAYDANGKECESTEVHTAGKADHIELTVDRTSLTADGEDMAFVTAKVVDKNGNLCPTASILLNFSVKGEGAFRAVCNGDATSLESFEKPQMHTFNGMLVFAVQSKESAGAISVAVSGKGLKNGVLKLNSLK